MTLGFLGVVKVRGDVPAGGDAPPGRLYSSCKVRATLAVRSSKRMARMRAWVEAPRPLPLKP